MSKFTDVQNEIEEIFASSPWIDNAIVTIPVNYDGDLPNEFVRLEILGNEKKFYYNGFGISGEIICSIFVPSGQGQSRLNEIAGLLDVVLQGKTLTSGTQTGPSSIPMQGRDVDNPALYRGDYKVGFNKFG